MCARVYTHARVLRMCVREASGSFYIYVHTNYLFRQGVAYRSDGYWPIIRPIFGTDDRIWTFVLCQFFFFSLFFHFPFLSASVFFTLLLQRVATMHVFCCSPTEFLLEISVFQTSRRMKQNRRYRHNKQIHFKI